ncbi:hypothetical protein F53441_6417 [Fusarium austroafricanum]|uniref:Carboxylesterase type B domain-containing protein n=1 Tax=Fusarium austroafricanum TaxID=2364996 RepID=A0A8H4KJK8_9HYPO|nr:hypothetical protein F53441_6417 [Fusarium austroafricanum]
MESLCRLVLLAVLFVPFSQAVDPTVDLGYSKYKGNVLGNGVSEWLGVRFAAPPVKDLRFKLPQDPIRTKAVQDATKRRSVCIGTDADPKIIGDTQSEDCLFLNIWAPSRASAKNKLPVNVYIQGGGFNGNSNANANASQLVVAGDLDMIVVSINYRVGVYGFLNDDDQITPNIGLHDQRKALQWVQKHISKFGGNPRHVVISGESAGAASVSLHLSAYGGKDEGLFHGAIAQSISFASMPTVKETVYQYNALAMRLGCVGPAKDILPCIRSKSPQEIQKINKNLPNLGSTMPPQFMWTPSIDGKLVPDVTYRLFEQGRFIKVPLLTGDDTNGGTNFVPVNTSSLLESNEFMKANFPFITLEQLGKINELYPNKNKTCPSPGCYWRQASDVYGDSRYMCSGLYVSNSLVLHGVPKSWNYWYDVQDPAQMAAGYGVPHVAENNAVFWPVAGAPASYFKGEKNAPVIPVIQAYWSSFIRTLDPNTHRHKGSVKWEQWTEKGQKRIKFETGGKTTLDTPNKDLQKKCEYWAEIGPAIQSPVFASSVRKVGFCIDLVVVFCDRIRKEDLCYALKCLPNCKTLVLTDTNSAFQLRGPWIYRGYIDQSSTTELPIENIEILTDKSEGTNNYIDIRDIIVHPPPTPASSLTSLQLKVSASGMEGDLMCADLFCLFMARFPQLSHSTLALENRSEHKPVFQVLLPALLPRLRVLELSYMKTSPTRVKGFLQRHQSTLEKVTLRDVESEGLADWAETVSIICHMPYVRVILHNCSLGGGKFLSDYDGMGKVMHMGTDYEKEALADLLNHEHKERFVNTNSSSAPVLYF